MTSIHFSETDVEAIAEFDGRVAVVIPVSGKLDTGARRVNRLTRGAIKRFVESEAWEKTKSGAVVSLAWPAGMKAKSVDILCLDRGADAVETRKAG
ncbi:MAG: leucyl aminopeptidase, partial [Pseudomonadota bacterium]